MFIRRDLCLSLFLIYNSFIWLLVQPEYFIEHDTFYDIHWTERNQSITYSDDVTLSTAKNEQFTCSLVQPTESIEKATELVKDEIGLKFGQMYLTLFGDIKRPSRFIDQYWTYEIRHGVDVRQVHEADSSANSNSNRQEYYLGYFDVEKHQKALSDKGPFDFKIVKTYILNKQYTGVAVNFDDGSLCSLIPNQSRNCTVIYVCDSSSSADRIMSVSEIATCTYEIVFKSSSICSIPGLNHTIQKQEVHCSSAVNGSGSMPSGLKSLQSTPLTPLTTNMDSGFLKVTTSDGQHVIVRFLMKDIDEESLATTTDDVINEDGGDSRSSLEIGNSGNADDGEDDLNTSIPDEKDMRDVPDRTSDGSTTTKQEKPRLVRHSPTTSDVLLSPNEKKYLREFFNGKPIDGKTLDPYWRFEFSYGHYLVHYHKEHPSAISNWNITLGVWIPEKHSEWFKFNSKYLDREVGEIANLQYTEGSICEEINQRRVTHIKLICSKHIPTNKQPFKIASHLIENRLCFYSLRLVSRIFCSDEIGVGEYGIPVLDNATG